MFRVAGKHVVNIVRGTLGVNTARVSAIGAVRASHDCAETDEEFDKRYEEYFNRADIDGWEIRKGMNELLGMDLIPDPKIIVAALKACRRVNDIALAIRWMEGCKEKCADQVSTVYPYLLQNIRPTLNELGVPTPEELGYDRPELALKSVFDM